MKIGTRCEIGTGSRGKLGTGCRLSYSRLEVGGWRLEVGGWRLEVGGWRLEVVCSLFSILSDIRYSKFVNRQSLIKKVLVPGSKKSCLPSEAAKVCVLYSLFFRIFDIRYWIFVIRNSSIHNRQSKERRIPFSQYQSA